MKMQKRKDGQYRIDMVFSRIIWNGVAFEQKRREKQRGDGT